MAQLPTHVVPGVPNASVAGATSGDVPRLPPGQIFSSLVQPAPQGSPPQAFQVHLSGQPILIQTALAFLPGERLVLRVEPQETHDALRLLARSGEAGGKLDTLPPGAVRLASGQALGGELRAMLTGANRPLVGHVLPFRHPGSAPVRLGSSEVLFQLDAGARSGDKLFIQPREAGGRLNLSVIARGGPRSAEPPAGARALFGVLRVGVSGPQAASGESVPTPGAILTGTLVRVMTPGVGAGLGRQGSVQEMHGPGAAALSGAQQTTGSPGESGRTPPPASADPMGGPPRGASFLGRAPGPSGGASPQRSALLRFSGFDVQVPWPDSAVRDFVPGQAVRVRVLATEPGLDLELLAPARGEGRWFPTGGGGERNFGSQLIGLAEGLEALPQGAPREAASGVLQALGRLVLRGEGDLTPERLQAALEQGGLASARAASSEGAEGLREGLERLLTLLRASAADDPLLQTLTGGAERALTSLEFLQAVNALRHVVEQSTFLQIPYFMGGEQGTLDIVVRRDGGRASEEEQGENLSAVLFLDLEGLGPVRIDAVLNHDRARVQFTTHDEEVGHFIAEEIPKLREAIEAREIAVEGISWLLGRPEPEPAVPRARAVDMPEEGSGYINLTV